MEVTKNTPVAVDVAPRRMTLDAMQKDFEYEMAQKLTKSLMIRALFPLTNTTE